MNPKRMRLENTALPRRDDDEVEDRARNRKTPKHQAKTKTKRPYVPYLPPFFAAPEKGPIECSPLLQVETVILRQIDLVTKSTKITLNGHLSNPPADPGVAVNPHWGTTPANPNAPRSKYPYMVADTPRCVVRRSAITGNQAEGTIKATALIAKTTVAIIPFGAGTKFTKENPMFPRMVQEFLKGLPFDGSKELVVASPSARNTPPPNAPFALPFAFFAVNVPSELKTFLLETQAFSFTRGSTAYGFFAHEIPSEAPNSWVLANYEGPYITSETDKMEQALTAIANQLAGNTAIVNEISTQLAARDIGASPP
ncbi:hypothetical protein ONZ45_g8752 [Pleurotus djamor]|nr:hypothetical protein ONZ45_g8752 [Pleurotus djamor]